MMRSVAGAAPGLSGGGMVRDAVEPETFASYLGRFLAGRLGYGPEVPAELAPVAAACDRLLVRADGPLLRVACIVDRDARPDAAFAVSPEDVLAAAMAWTEAAKWAGRRKPSVLVTVYEVGAGVVTPEAERRLAAYVGDPRRGRRLVLRAALVDPGQRRVWDNARRAFARPLAFRWLRRLLARQRLSDADLAPGAVAGDVGRFPVLTAAILAALLAIFAAEVLVPVAPWTGTLKADIRTLVAFGGVDRTLVLARGEWWRLATAPLLHADALHILFNGWALWLIGRLSERLIGPAWFAAVFAVSALSGSALSIAVNPANLLSVGASGAIVGLFAASFTLSFRVPVGAVRTRLQSRTVGTLVPALIPFLSGTNGGNVDYGAHGGGAAAGLAMGLLLLSIWPRSLPRPRFARVAWAVAACGLGLALAALVPDLANYRAVSLAQNLFEPFPRSDAEARIQSAVMVAAKPRDPRARFAHALALVAAHDLGGAEAELRAGLAERDLLGLVDPPHYEDRMRLVLAAVLKDENRPADARAAAAPACDAEKAGPLRDALAKMQLCP